MDTVPSPQQDAAGHAAGRAAAAALDQVQQFLRLSLGSDPYAVRIDSVREILEVAQLTPLPLMPAFVRGVMNLRGAVVPVIDLAARLGLPATVLARRSCVVMVDVRPAQDQPAYTIGVLVDAVYEVFSASAAEQEAPPRLGTRIDPAFIRSMVRLRGLPTPELQLTTILDPTVLAELIATHHPAPLH
jgi:purine-binding chemotaxis protein CheW